MVMPFVQCTKGVFSKLKFYLYWYTNRALSSSVQWTLNENTKLVNLLLEKISFSYLILFYASAFRFN